MARPLSREAGLARGGNEIQNSNVPFTADSRINLASISKTITGVALEVFLSGNPSQTLDTLFLPTLQPRLTKPPVPAAATVTLQQLAAMNTGLFVYPLDGTGSTEGPADIVDQVGNFGPYPSTWADISDYLSQSPNSPPGYEYNNTNYAILQGYLELALNPNASDPQDYTNWVTANVIAPAMMDATVASPVPCDANHATLAYAGPLDNGPGHYYQQFTLVGASGWISSARELIKLMNALRGTALLPASTVNSMFSNAIGAWVQETTAFGNVYYKDGGLSHTSGGVTRNINTGAIRLAEGYDIVIVANSQPPLEVRQIAINAYVARGLSTANLPAGPITQAVVSSASYLPSVAPGGFVSIFGAGLIATPAMDWTDAIISGVLPTELGGVTVRVNGVWASIAYVSASQINCILPSSTPTGIINIEVNSPLGGTTPLVSVSAVAPALFTYQANSTLYAAAVFATGTGIVYAGPPGAIPGESSRPAMTGDLIELYGTGMGPTDPPAPDGVELTQPYPADLSNFAVSIGGQPATVLFAGLGSLSGVYQINIQVPPNVPAGDQPIVVSVNQVASAPNVMITIQA